jgi:Kef-type K+ transport system membrane component KefB
MRLSFSNTTLWPGSDDVQLTIDLVENLAEFKSIILPLFFVSQGGLKDKNSFNLNNTTKNECEFVLIFVGIGYMLYGPKVYEEK